MAVPVVVWPKVEVCSCLIAGIAGSNPTEGKDVRLFCMLCVV